MNYLIKGTYFHLGLDGGGGSYDTRTLCLGMNLLINIMVQNALQGFRTSVIIGIKDFFLFLNHIN